MAPSAERVVRRHPVITLQSPNTEHIRARCRQYHEYERCEWHLDGAWASMEEAQQRERRPR